MASLNMGSSYALTLENIYENIEEGRIGNYAFGFLNDRGAFVVRYVGRSDTDLRERIKHGIRDMEEDPERYQYERFKFCYADSPREAYVTECRNYHDFGGDRGFLINLNHPAAPIGENIACPFCGRW